MLIHLPVVRGYVDLVSRAAQQILQSVLLHRGADLRRVPVAEFRLVVDRVSVDRGVVLGVRAHLHRQRVGGGRGEGDLGRVRGSCEVELVGRVSRNEKFILARVLSHRARSTGG